MSTFFFNSDFNSFMKQITLSELGGSPRYLTPRSLYISPVQKSKEREFLI